ncbi:MAG TPA: DUF4190 domain-containing protein [Nocardioidaceae bacterium]|nr:DUF4190 domain-containing protein [Nocardioidaceae bacterium]
MSDPSQPQYPSSGDTPPPPPSYGQQPGGQQPPQGWGQEPPQGWGQQPPQGYYPPQYYGPLPQRATNGLAIASLVLGIVWLYWIGSILALVFGYVARRQIRERNQNGDGMAIAGIVLGWVGIGSLVLLIAVGTIVSITESSYSGY